MNAYAVETEADFFVIVAESLADACAILTRSIPEDDVLSIAPVGRVANIEIRREVMQ
ncbi:MAG: hypothetical protein ACYCY2_02285 [Acidithiobacillus ferriphilus]